MNPETKNCQNCKKDFTVESDDFLFYEKMKVPPPTFCPECRLIRRLSWRNERTLYKRDCDLCKKTILAAYSPDSEYVVYCPECWWSDKWSPKDFGVKYDFTKPFFNQFDELMKRVPQMSCFNTNSIETIYSNYVIGDNRVYYSFSSHYNEDSGYLVYSNKCKSSYDCLHVGNSDKAVDCNYCDRLYNCAHLMYSYDCSDCYFGHDLRNCSNCIGCVNLRNASYKIFNKQYSKEDYLKLKKEIFTTNNSFEEAKSIYSELKKEHPIPESYQNKCVDSTGNDLMETKSMKHCFSVKKGEDCKYVYVNAVNIKNSMDLSNSAADLVEFIYECQGMSESSNMKFCSSCWNADSFCSYSSACYNSQNLFGCIGMNKAFNCILNYEYSKEEYEGLLPKIIEHMNNMPYISNVGHEYKYGEFFPSDISPFAYNESIAIQYFPIIKNEAITLGYTWKNKEKPDYQITFDNTQEYSLSIINEELSNEVFGCSHNGTCVHQCPGAFKMTNEELRIYKQVGIPLPNLCPNCRHYGHLKDRGGFNITKSDCKNCGKNIETVFDPTTNIIFCKECFTKEVV